MTQLVEFEKTADGNLLIRLLPEGQEEIQTSKLLDKPINEAMSVLFEEELCNGWEWIEPHEIGALTSSPILSDTAVRDDFGNLESVETVYWFPNYQIISEVEELYEKGEVIFEGKQLNS